MSNRTFITKRNQKRFRLINGKELIGEGSYGAVFLDRDANRCIKVGDIGPKEFKYLYQLSKYGIAPKPIKVQSNRTELIMEYIDGYTLRETIDITANCSYHDAGTWTQELFIKLIDTLEIMHTTLHLAHGDLHNENIMYDAVNEKFKIIDAASISHKDRYDILSNLYDFKYQFHLPSLLRQYTGILVDELFDDKKLLSKKDFYRNVKTFYKELRANGTGMIIYP